MHTLIYRSQLNVQTGRFDKVAEYKGADLRQLGNDHRFPGMFFQLRVPSPDPETKEMTDCDGDNAYAYLEMHGCELHMFGPGDWQIKGFVEDSESRNFHTRLVDGEYGDMRHNGQFSVEEWTVMLHEDA